MVSWIDEEQFEYIKQVIDDSDYYVLILGGLYGTIVGFYVRVNGTTLGTLEDSIYVNKNTDVGRYILSYCLKCFETPKEYPTLKSCIEDSGLML